MAIVLVQTTSGGRHYFWNGSAWAGEFSDGRQFESRRAAGLAIQDDMTKEDVAGGVALVKNYGFNDEAWAYWCPACGRIEAWGTERPTCGCF